MKETTDREKKPKAVAKMEATPGSTKATICPFKGIIETIAKKSFDFKHDQHGAQ